MNNKKILQIIASCDFGGGSKHLIELSKLEVLKKNGTFIVQRVHISIENWGRRFQNQS